jgi:Ribonuclease HII
MSTLTTSNARGWFDEPCIVGVGAAPAYSMPQPRTYVDRYPLNAAHSAGVCNLCACAAVLYQAQGIGLEAEVTSEMYAYADEAGRGSVMGPMVYAVAVAPASYEANLKTMCVRATVMQSQARSNVGCRSTAAAVGA